MLVATLSCGPRLPRPESLEVSAPADGAVLLRNGPNTIALLGDSTPGLVFVSWRGNYNAHGYSVVTFSIRGHSDLDDSASIWQNVPFFGGPNDGETGRELF